MRFVPSPGALLWLGALALSVRAEELRVPDLAFAYGRIYDESCADGFGLAKPDLASARLNPTWATEIKERLPDFQSMWKRDGAPLAQELVRFFGKGFARKELVVTLSACRATPSMGTPLILNVTHFLKTYMVARPTQGSAEFAVLLFHELLHVWLTEHLPATTPLLTKYAAESLPTRNHLHLVAIQRYLMRKLKRQDMLDFMKSDYVKMGGGHKRAWDIVEQEEDNFIRELLPSAQ